MIDQVFDLELLPVTHNADLALLFPERPKTLTLKEFEELPVSLSELELRNKIYLLEEIMFANPLAVWGKDLHEMLIPQHTFTDNIYTRELEIPAGYIVIGKRHSLEHQVMLIKGSCICITERGIEYMTAPMHFISPAGEKRIVYTNSEDAVWVTIHPNPSNNRNIDFVEDYITISEPERLQVYLEERRKVKFLNTPIIEYLGV